MNAAGIYFVFQVKIRQILNKTSEINLKCSPHVRWVKSSNFQTNSKIFCLNESSWLSHLSNKRLHLSIISSNTHHTHVSFHLLTIIKDWHLNWNKLISLVCRWKLRMPAAPTLFFKFKLNQGQKLQKYLNK